MGVGEEPIHMTTGKSGTLKIYHYSLVGIFLSNCSHMKQKSQVEEKPFTSSLLSVQKPAVDRGKDDLNNCYSPAWCSHHVYFSTSIYLSSCTCTSGPEF